MKPLSINLAGRPFYNRTLYLVAYGVSATVLIIMTVLNVFLFTANQVSLGHLSDARAGMEREMADLDRKEQAIRGGLGRIDLAKLVGEVRFTREALLGRYFSWTLLFSRLEALMPLEVKLLSIRPSIEEDHILISVTGVAKSPEAFTRFEEELLRSALFADVYPQSEVWEGDKRGLNFTLTFRYLPERAEEAARAGEALEAAEPTEPSEPGDETAPDQASLSVGGGDGGGEG